jgi:ketosteroid isomerase-like protein
VIDRRKMVRIELDRVAHLHSLRLAFEMRSSRFRGQHLATRGDKLALERERFEGSDGDVGPSEVEFLEVVEVDDRGDRVAMVVFDPEDLDAACAELDDRYAAGEAAPYSRTWEVYRRHASSAATRDWERLASGFAPDLVIEDHRPLGLLTLRSRDKFVASVRALLDLRPDARLRVDHVLALDDRRSVTVVRWEGGEPEGTFEIPAVVVTEYGPDGMRRREELYGLDQLDEAWARLAELRPDPLRIPPNAATRASDRAWECIERRDWEALRALCAPIVWEDRRRLVRTTGDRDALVTNAKLMSRSRTRVSRTVLATAGDRLALQRIGYTGPPEGPGHEIEHLELTEVDAEGRVAAVIDFDPDDRSAASAELLDRHARSDAARCIPAAVFETFRAINDHDLDRLRASLPDDFVYQDHRRTGLGRLEGVEDYVASLRPLFEETRDFSTDNLYYVAAETHGSLAVARTFGTLAAGGEFESVFARLLLYRDGRIGAVEQFELEHLDVARARFEELRPGAFPSVSSAGNDGGDAP